MSFPEADLLRAVYRAGTLSLPRSFIPFVTSFKKALFDTGALHGSYISSSFVSSHANILSPYIRPLDSAVTLADNRTSIKIEGVISLLISFVDDENHLHSASISLFIFPMTQQDYNHRSSTHLVSFWCFVSLHAEFLCLCHSRCSRYIIPSTFFSLFISSSFISLTDSRTLVNGTVGYCTRGRASS